MFAQLFKTPLFSAYCFEYLKTLFVLSGLDNSISRELWCAGRTFNALNHVSQVAVPSWNGGLHGADRAAPAIKMADAFRAD